MQVNKVWIKVSLGEERSRKEVTFEASVGGNDNVDKVTKSLLQRGEDLIKGNKTEPLKETNKEVTIDSLFD